MLTSDILKELLHYDPMTGIFKWRVKKNGVRNDKIAGHIDSNGYCIIVVNRKNYKAHRLAWLYMTEIWPNDQLDHYNGHRSDNRWCNIRESTNQTNMQNQRSARTDSHYGFMGVTFDARNPFRPRPWMARIALKNGQRKYLGGFSSPEEAHKAYLIAKRELHEGCTL